MKMLIRSVFSAGALLFLVIFYFNVSTYEHDITAILSVAGHYSEDGTIHLGPVKIVKGEFHIKYIRAFNSVGNLKVYTLCGKRLIIPVEAEDRLKELLERK